MRHTKKQQQNSQQQKSQDISLIKLRAWMQNVQPLKLTKISEDIMTSMLENWSKFRITVLKTLNQHENKVLDCMGRLRKQVQWLNQIKLGETPQLNKITSKLFKECQEMEEKDMKFQLKMMLKQSKLLTDNMLDSVKTVFEEIRQKITSLVQNFKQVTTIKEILTQKTYFKFLQKKHHADIELINDTAITVHNQSHDMDFGAVIGPALTQTNFRIALKMQRNDKYQSFVGVGVCHPAIVKENYYKGCGPGSGCYMIRQESDNSHTSALSHAYEKEGSHKRPKAVPWGFGEGDYILIEMDFKNGKVCFSKEQEYYEMKVDLEQGPISPYVVLHSKWDTVSIINQ